MSEPITSQVHAGPVKTPKQLLIAGLLSFVVPIVIIIALVAFVTSGNRPSLGAANPERGIELRIQKVGTVEIRDANRPLKAGQEVYDTQCVACHVSGVAGAPKFQDVAAWAPRIAIGYEALLHSALAGKGAMAPQGGGDFNDTEIGLAVVYMANAAGANFDEPPAAVVAADPATMPQVAVPAAIPQNIVASAAPALAPDSPALAGPAPVSAETLTAASAKGAGEALYKQACQVCHAAGVAGAPKLGDKQAWASRIETGKKALYKAAVNGIGAMPARGGTSASDADIHAAVDYMVESSK